MREESTGERRAQLLAARRARTGAQLPDEHQDTVNEKIDREIEKLLKNEPINKHLNPLNWWKHNEKEFPLLAKFVKANAAMQPTSVSSERLFNKDKQLFGFTRKSLTEEHARASSSFTTTSTSGWWPRSSSCAASAPSLPARISPTGLPAPSTTRGSR